MDKRLIIGAAAGCVAMAAIAAKKNRSAEPKPNMWDKMREGMEQMPEDFPPRVMFENVETTRANSEQILDLLQKQKSPKDDIEVVPTTQATS